ncbi:hypothetical protein GGX14DRAFT_699525 [Mycena pura]|uniref:Uncharacterized protein n=1 Tax=Mycena pura TaxID=153505 RepID=A0AAD6V2W0_9AGAR|nr:hypothetical protein GGX14DRAFT_699525 [Mycena pura]
MSSTDHDQLDRLRAFYQKSWGHSWPTHEVSADIPTDDSDDATASDSNDDGSDEAMATELADVSRVFTVYDDMQEVAIALDMLSDVMDVLVIREEYKYLHAALKDRRARVRSSRKCAVVVTGQPGIGKTTFLLYLLLCRLQQKSPTAIQINDDYFCLFDEEGVAVFEVKQRDCERLRACWALVDRNSSVEIPCNLFISHAMFIIQASSPKPTGWLKQLGGYLIVSELPTTLEIAVIATELGLDATLTGRLVRKWGPSTRDIIRLLELWSDEEGKEELEGELQNYAEAAARAALASSGGLAAMMADINARALSIDSTGSAVVFVRPFRGGGRRWLGRSQPFIPTKHLAGIVREQGT